MFVLLLAGSLNIVAESAEGPSPTYERDVRPLLTQHCTVCHNAKKRGDLDVSGGLALDTLEAVLEGTKDRKVVVPGSATKSEILLRCESQDEDERMPLFDKPLPPPKREVLKRWIDAGAPRGEVVVVASAPAVRSSRRIVRSLDVVLPVETRIPPKVEGFGPGGAIQTLLRVGPLPAVSALAFRGDGRQLAVGTFGAVVVWDLADARPALLLAEIPGPVHALAFSRDGKQLAVGGGLPARSGVVRIYSVPDGTLVHDFQGHDDVVFGLSFRPDGVQLASASFDQTVRVWNLALGRPEGVFRGHSDFVYDVVYTKDGRSLLSVSKDRTIKLVDVKTMKEKRTYSGHDEDVLALAIQPSGSKFVTAGHEPRLRWWGLDSESPTMQVGGHGGPVHQVSFSANGKHLISAGGDSSVRLWNGESGIFVRSLPGPTDWQYAVALSGDGELAAAGGWDGVVRIWDTAQGKLRATLLQPPAEDGEHVEWLALAPSGYLTASSHLATLVRWRVGNLEVPRATAMSVFERVDEVARSLRGETVTAPSFAQPSARPH